VHAPGIFLVVPRTYDERPAREKMRRAVDALVANPDPLPARIAAAEKPFRELDPGSDLPSGAEQALYHRIASTIVSGGDDHDDHEEDENYDEAAAIAESIAALDEERLIMIACDMLRLYELVGNPPDITARWPPDWPAGQARHTTFVSLRRALTNA
jgi:hypothetical protein